MENGSFNDQCADLTQEFKIKIPCRLAERVESYASSNKTTITVVVIEALDLFLREQRNRAG
jgi:hypothetical protein